jgi:hypothetical protein
MITSIQSVYFFRTEKDAINENYEHGLLFNEGEFGIIDDKGQVLEGVWSYNITSNLSITNIKIGNPHKKDEIRLGNVGDKFKCDLDNEDVFVILEKYSMGKVFYYKLGTTEVFKNDDSCEVYFL